MPWTRFFRGWTRFLPRGYRKSCQPPVRVLFLKQRAYFLKQPRVTSPCSDSSGPPAFIAAAHLPPNALIPEKFRFLIFFYFFFNWSMKNFYFFIFKKSRDLTGRLHLSPGNLTVCWVVVVLGPCLRLVVACSFARSCAHYCAHFFANYCGEIFIRSWVLFLCILRYFFI